MTAFHGSQDELWANQATERQENAIVCIVFVTLTRYPISLGYGHNEP